MSSVLQCYTDFTTIIRWNQNNQQPVLGLRGLRGLRSLCSATGPLRFWEKWDWAGEPHTNNEKVQRNNGSRCVSAHRAVEGLAPRPMPGSRNAGVVVATCWFWCRTVVVITWGMCFCSINWPRPTPSVNITPIERHLLRWWWVQQFAVV